MEQQKDALDLLAESNPRETDAEKARKATVTTSEELSFDPGEFERVLAKVTQSASDGDYSATLRRRTVSVTIFPEMCRPDTFDNAIRVDMEELDSGAELDALRVVQGSVEVSTVEDADGNIVEEQVNDAVAMGYSLSMALGKRAIVAVNGFKLDKDRIELLWEMIGPSGRLAVGMAFMEAGLGMDMDLVDRSLKSVVVG